VKSIRLLQIGDIHYPDAVREVYADIKDKGFPAGLTSLTHTNPLQAVVRRLVDQKVDGILICGDLTSKGNIPEYQKCVQYLVDNLAPTSADRLHTVPGNHDVERSRSFAAMS
jgi:predicted phosphodiesterase